MILRNMASDVWMSMESGSPLVFVSYFKLPNNWHEFFIAEYRMKSRRAKKPIVFTKEVFRTRIYTVTPDSTLRDIATSLAYTNDPTNPVELAYIYGGTVRGESVKILNTNPLH